MLENPNPALHGLRQPQIFNPTNLGCTLRFKKQTGPMRLIWYDITSSIHNIYSLVLVEKDIIQSSVNDVTSFKSGLEPAV